MVADTVLVTGCAGFIGSSLVDHLHRQFPHARIIGLDLLTYAGSITSVPDEVFSSERFEFWHGDVGNPDLVEELVARSDVVIHLAAETHVSRSIHASRYFLETDAIGTQSVANAVVKHRDRVRLLAHMSTCEVYGTALRPAMDEGHPLSPMSPYAAAKCAADRLASSYFHTFGIPVVILRPFNNYGPRQHLEKLVPRMIASCLRGEPLTVHGDGRATRDWMHVRDLCEAIGLVLQAPPERLVGQVLNLGAGDERSVLDVARTVRSALGAEVPIVHVEDRPGQVTRHACDATKARELLGWEAATPFADGLKSTIAWYQEHEDWWQRQVRVCRVPVTVAGGRKEWH
ncbi:MAG TPA: GDP-mannose 4,6-dehydratase [Micromonosporaceae bacterium]|nr:GDP-mannose 4,6-dehydratase [Micromonosporaceae bacterium]